MFPMADIEVIRRKHYRDDWSIRKIARQLEVSRQTVRKALNNPGPWEYTLAQPKPSPVMDPFRDIILEWLRQDQDAPVKQRHTGKRIFERLVEEHGFGGAASTVRRYVGQLRRELAQEEAEVFFVLESSPGEMAQVDWGQAWVVHQSESQKVHVFCLRLHFSGVSFACAFPHERLETFLEGHVRAFEWLGGIPDKLVYDNLTPVVHKILGNHQRKLHKRFLALRGHYLFESVFCNPGSPHEKGSVENLVGYVRRNALTPVPEVDSYHQLDDHLLNWCEQERQARTQSWNQESQAFHPLPKYPFDPATRSDLGVDSLSLITFDKQRYSVPTYCIGREVSVSVTSEWVGVWYQHALVAEHARVYGDSEPQLVLSHYLSALTRKPYAVMNAKVVRQLPCVYQQSRQRLCRHDPSGYREFARILLLHREFPATWIEEALTDALLTGVLSADALRSQLQQRAGLSGVSDDSGRLHQIEELRQVQVPVGSPQYYEQLVSSHPGEVSV